MLSCRWNDGNLDWRNHLNVKRMERKSRESEKRNKSDDASSFNVCRYVGSPKLVCWYSQGKHLLDESLLIMNEEATAMRLPRDYIVHPICLELS
jgi:hypothetical protein